MDLTNKQSRQLKALAHHLKPVVMVGNKGLTDHVLEEIDAALAHHELIKVRLPAVPKPDRQGLTEQICSYSGCIPVNLTGRISILYKPNPDKKNPLNLNG